MENALGLTLAGGLLVGFAAIVVYSAVKLNKAMSLDLVDTGQIALNDGASTCNTFISLLHEARKSMIVYDDGDKVEDSIYNNAKVVESLREKLLSNPDFSIRCVFNSDETELRLRKEARDLGSGVQIRIRNPSAPVCRIHYKIIDDGLQAYLSRHKSEETQRRYRIVNCSNVPVKHQKYASDVMLGPFKKHFQEAFSAGIPV